MDRHPDPQPGTRDLYSLFRDGATSGTPSRTLHWCRAMNWAVV